MKEKVENWIGEVTKLASMATTHPQEAYAALTHGLTDKWVYFMQTILNIADMLKPLEDGIRLKLIPPITGNSGVSDLSRNLLALPARLGGLTIPNPSTMFSKEYEASMKVTGALVDAICQQSYHDVCVEPPLQALSGEHLSHATANREDNARLDVKVRGFWNTPHQCAFFDVRVFKPKSEPYRNLEMATCYRRHEGEKRRAYKNYVSVR